MSEVKTNQESKKRTRKTNEQKRIDLESELEKLETRIGKDTERIEKIKLNLKEFKRTENMMKLEEKAKGAGITIDEYIESLINK